MSTSSLTLESLFGDLNLEMGLEPASEASAPAPAPVASAAPPPAGPQSSFSDAFADEAEATLEEVGFTSVSAFLSDSDQPTRPTCPYDIPAAELAHTVSMWGDDERFSAISTTPWTVEELPPDAYPTQLNLVEPE